MKLFLIRHGETVDNVAQVYAGVTDSALTVHGTVQARRLGAHLSKTAITHMFSSPLQRAVMTAEAVLAAQSSKLEPLATTGITQLSVLQEKNFGLLEKKRFRARPKTGNDIDMVDSTTGLDESHTSMETKAEMAVRANDFIDHHLIPVLTDTSMRQEMAVAVVSHGMLLSTLWKCLLRRFEAQDVTIDHNAAMSSGQSHGGLEHLGAWSNTGYLEVVLNKLPLYLRNRRRTLDAAQNQAEHINKLMLQDWTMAVKVINCRDHLMGLKRTGGGVGSSRFDEGQSSIDTFFKRQRYN